MCGELHTGLEGAAVGDAVQEGAQGGVVSKGGERAVDGEKDVLLEVFTRGARGEVAGAEAAHGGAIFSKDILHRGGGVHRARPKGRVLWGGRAEQRCGERPGSDMLTGQSR